MAERKRAAKLTQKQRVLKDHPGAWLWYRPQCDDYIVMPKGGRSVFEMLGFGDTARAAWKDAASREPGGARRLRGAR